MPDRMTSKIVLLLPFVATLASCAVGDRARDVDVRRELSGLDVAYFEARAKDRHTDNSQSLEGRLSGMPFWFVPALTLRYDSNTALHRGEAIVGDGTDKTPRALVSGYQHDDGFAYGLGLLGYRHEQGRWDREGGLEHWRDSYGLGWGLVYSNRQWGDANGRKGLSAKILGGLLGFSQERSKGYLHLLWIPIPW